MPSRCTAAPRRVFSLFYFCDTKTQKITKNARDLLYLCVINFFHEQKKTQFFKKKKLWQNRYSYTLNQNRHERFSSRKKTRKNVRKTRSRCMDGHQNRWKMVHFSCKIIIMFSLKNHYFWAFPVYRRSKKSNKKSFIFNIKINVFLRAKSLFSSFPVYGCRQKTCTKLSFFIENSSFFTQKSLFFQRKINVFTHLGV